MCGRPGAPVQLMRLTLFLVVDSAAARRDKAAAAHSRQSAQIPLSPQFRKSHECGDDLFPRVSRLQLVDQRVILRLPTCIALYGLPHRKLNYVFSGVYGVAHRSPSMCS